MTRLPACEYCGRLVENGRRYCTNSHKTMASRRRKKEAQAEVIAKGDWAEDEAR